MTYKPSKLGHTDVVFGLLSEFISSRLGVDCRTTNLHV